MEEFLRYVFGTLLCFVLIIVSGVIFGKYADNHRRARILKVKEDVTETEQVRTESASYLHSMMVEKAKRESAEKIKKIEREHQRKREFKSI